MLGVCVLQKFQQSGLGFEKSDPQIASWYELALLRFTTSKIFAQKITVRFKLKLRTPKPLNCIRGMQAV